MSKASDFASALLRLVKPALKTRPEVIACISTIGKNQTIRAAKVTAMDAEIQIIRNRYAEDIALLDEAIDEDTGRVHSWAKQYRDKEFHGEQTLILGGHQLEFRNNPGAVATTGDLSEKDVIENIFRLEGEAGDMARVRFIRVKPELNKVALKSEYYQSEKQPERRAALVALGITVKSKENFNVLPAHEEMPDMKEQIKGREEAA